MSVGSQRFRVRRGGSSLRLAHACGIVTALLILSSGALAATPTRVVPIAGKVAGHGYAYWLQRSWQTVFSTAPVSPCQTLTVHRDRVAYLTLETVAAGTDSYTCSEPAGRPIYAVELSNECSTFPDDHGSYGTTNDQLRLCARELFKGAQETTTIDGRPVNVEELVTGTRAYHVRAAKNNILDFPPGEGRSAAYGFGLLLTGFERGTHVIHTEASIGTARWNITFTVHVQ